jgi:acetylglutamate kinase
MAQAELLVVKIGGNVIDSPPLLALFLDSFAQLPGPKVLVHGGGKLATKLAGQLGVAVQMHQGRRLTDGPTLDIAVMVYGGLVNKNLVAGLQARQCQALGLAGADLDLVRAVRRPVRDGVDYGLVGDVRAVNTGALRALLDQGTVPVLAPLSHDGASQLLNTNADTIASEVAVAMSAHFPTSLLFCFEKNGVLASATDDDSVIARLDPASYAGYLADGTVSGGMVPKLDNAFAALRRGVRQVYIFHAQAMPQFGQPGFVGTQITGGHE